jgi:hypothetical protein
MRNPLKYNIFDSLCLLKNAVEKPNPNYLDIRTQYEKVIALVKQIPEEEEVYFLTTNTALSDEQYARVKEQIDEAWPKTKTRPILLEGLTIVKA